jgi:ABC-2 type transport system ATP-binding protein
LITVRGLRKHYSVHERPPGLLAALRSVVHREYRTVKAVDGVSFDVAPGERVGFLGPNGAGKTTTLKVLSGLLHPTEGTARVDGFEPSKRDDDFLRAITLVLGQKQQLMWDLPPVETFALNRAVYGVPKAQFEATVAELSELLELGDLARRPTRQLSLGERMKCELVAALLHRPKVLFLDEPTIGLDVPMQATIRAFVKQYNERYGATLMLTSHYMDDVVALCPRVIVIDQGQIAYDGALDELARRLKPEKSVVLRLERRVVAADLEGLGTVVRHDAGEIVLRVRPADVHEVVARALAQLPVSDLTVENPPIEEVMTELFAQSKRMRGGGEA